MSYITSLQFQTDTGINLPQNGFTAGYIDLILKAWSEDIDSYTNTKFNLILNYTNDYPIPNCNASYININSWQANSLVIKQLNKNKEITKLLVENIDYRLVKSFDGQCIIALDFKCLGCICECDFIRINGTFGWGANLPDTLKLGLYQAVRALISSGTGGSNSNSSTPVGTISYIQQERSRNMTRVRQIDTQYATISSSLATGKSIVKLPDFEAKLAKYKANTTNYFINFGFNCC